VPTMQMYSAARVPHFMVVAGCIFFHVQLPVANLNIVFCCRLVSIPVDSGELRFQYFKLR
ncbi:Uncharacterized protein APZ42_010042, partial [Daphnia magna]